MGRLRKLSNNTELAEHLPLELRRIGFSRVLFSHMRGNKAVVRSAHIAGDADLTATLLRVGRAHPQRACQPLPEAARARDNTELVDIVKPNVYIAALTDSGEVGAEDRDLLGLFAEGLGAIMERNIVAERMRSLRNAAQQHVERMHSLTGLFEDDLDLTGCSTNTYPADDDTITGDIAEHLTRRERQVLNLMAAGKTNAQIGARLFISDGTVKSHVRHIMHKVGASNRTEVVARYQSPRRYPPPQRKR